MACRERAEQLLCTSGEFEVDLLQYWLVGVVGGALAAFLLWRWLPPRSRTRGARFAQARREFHLQRERLEAKFLQLGMIGAKSDAPRWTGCDFDDDVAYARNRSTGELTAFVGVTIEIDDAADSSGTKDAVGNLLRGHRDLSLRPQPLGNGRPGAVQSDAGRGHPLFPPRSGVLGSRGGRPALTGFSLAQAFTPGTCETPEYRGFRPFRGAPKARGIIVRRPPDSGA